MMELYQSIGAACGFAGLVAWAATLFYGVLASTRDDETPKPRVLVQPCDYPNCIGVYGHDGRHVVRASSFGRRR